jgi:hypothetical protein
MTPPPFLTVRITGAFVRGEADYEVVKKEKPPKVLIHSHRRPWADNLPIQVQVQRK